MVTVTGGRFVYDTIDQKVVDGAVNGSGYAAEGGGQVFRTMQTGKVQQYGAILFAATAVMSGMEDLVIGGGISGITCAAVLRSRAGRSSSPAGWRSTWWPGRSALPRGAGWSGMRAICAAPTG